MKIITHLLALAAVTGVANAATISVNFAESSGGHASQQLAAGTSAGHSDYAASNWNNVGGGSGTASNLNDNTGAATTASVTWSAVSAWGDQSAENDASSGNGNAQMRRGWIDDYSGTVNIDVTGITYTQYTLVL